MLHEVQAVKIVIHQVKKGKCEYGTNIPTNTHLPIFVSALLRRQGNMQLCWLRCSATRQEEKGCSGQQAVEASLCCMIGMQAMPSNQVW